MAVQRKAPLLFIAHGLGDLVVQEAAIQRASGLNILQETDVGYIFLNTPFPNYQGSDRWDKDKYGFFSFIQRTRRYDFVELALASEGRFSNGRLWMEFVNAVSGRVKRMPIAWVYRSDEASFIPPSFSKLFVSVNGPSSAGFHTLSHHAYKSVVALIRSPTALHASKYPELLVLLKLAFEAPGFPKDVCDGSGSSLLHLAASFHNQRAVEFLVFQARQRRLFFKHKDRVGRRPLHTAVIAAAQLLPDGDRKTCQEIIKILMSSTSSIDHHDGSRCTAWDYVKPENPIMSGSAC
ncbi:hypothetical protein ASPCAL00464 [Aspergillus calidoustus]|uniref:Uncharacterized protein n=1 Tax=Aspergillus calidoustus TaxID=454130 RepID=A0A0U5FQF0_ASPCI|nr:hypothetical protein ASPCAL00464 [Aspergillus calidoustus]